MRRAQVSFEFMMVTGIALFILAAATMFFFEYTQQSEDVAATNQAAQIGYTLVGEAANVYTFGNGSFVTIRASMPAEVRAMYVAENALVVELGTARGVQTVPIFTTVPIDGVRPDGDRSHVNPAGVSVHAGATSFRVTSRGDVVRIEQVS